MGHAALDLHAVGIRHPDAEIHTPTDVTFSVAPGEVVLLLGPSGCGKSTLALTFNGLIPHAVGAEVRGAVRVAGLDTREATVGELSRQVGMVFQDPDAQIIAGTVIDEVCFGPENLLLDAAEVLSRAEEALRTVGLWELRGERPERLSGGQRQRLAIACAIAMRPRLLVFDEPTANLDPVGVEEVYRALSALVAERARSIVLIEHNLDAAIDLIDRVVVLDSAGEVACAGTPGEILAARANQLLALGVWLPVATLAALRLRERGVSLDPLPLVPAELGAALDRIATLPDPPGGEHGTGERNAQPDRPVVSVRGLSVQRGRRPVLRGLDLDIARGELLAVVGSNGAGKSTLLRAIAGIGRTRRGEVRGSIRVDGRNPSRMGAAELADTIGFVFQNPEHQFACDTAAAELAHSLRVLRPRPSEEEIAARTDEMLDRLGLRPMRDRHPFLLSGGQKRRLSVGTALIAGARVLVLDEPTYGQDREHAVELMSMLEQLRERGITIVLATHDIQLVADHATHVAVLHGGRLAVHAPTAQVLARETLIDVGLRPPPLALAMRSLRRHPRWQRITRLQEIPGGPS